MQVTTTFNIGDEAYVITQKIQKVCIKEICVYARESGNVYIEYKVKIIDGPNCIFSYDSDSLFTTREEAGEFWLRCNGLNTGVKETI